MSVSLADWGNFYVITGSSAAALTGLTFVVNVGVSVSLRKQQESR